MSRERRRVLGGLAVAVGAMAAVILLDVLDVTALAIGAGYVLLPVHRRIVARGLGPWASSLLSSMVAFSVTIALLLPFATVIYFRRQAVLAFLTALPATYRVRWLGTAVTVETAAIRELLVPDLAPLAVSLAASFAVIASKIVLLGMVVFALMYHHDRLRLAVLAPMPSAYYDALDRFHRRVRATLFALYVAKVVTAVVTYLLALVVFLALGYSLPFTMALVAGLLRLVPLLTPWLLVGGLSVYHLGVGQVGLAASVGIAGGGLIAAFPYRVLRPWLFPDTAPLSPMLYVPGFFGGLLTMGVVGIFVGPVVLVALSEVVTLLARETRQG